MVASDHYDSFYLLQKVDANMQNYCKHASAIRLVIGKTFAVKNLADKQIDSTVMCRVRIIKN